MPACVGSRKPSAVMTRAASLDVPWYSAVTVDCLPAAARAACISAHTSSASGLRTRHAPCSAIAKLYLLAT